MEYHNLPQNLRRKEEGKELDPRPGSEETTSSNDTDILYDPRHKPEGVGVDFSVKRTAR